MTCEEYRQFVDATIDDTTRAQCMAIVNHTRSCSECARFSFNKAMDILNKLSDKDKEASLTAMLNLVQEDRADPEWSDQ